MSPMQLRKRRRSPVSSAANRASVALLGMPLVAQATSLIAPNGYFLNDPGQPYSDDPRLQYDTRMMFRNTINGGAIAIGDEWVLHCYHAVFPHNNTSGVDGYVGQVMDQLNNDGSGLASYRVTASRESATLDYAVFRIARIAGAATEPANLPIWVDPREIYPSQPGIAMWGSFGPQRILIDGSGAPVQDPPHPRGLKWGTIAADGFSSTGLPSDVQEVAGDSGSGIFVREGFNLRLLAVHGEPLTTDVQQQISQWVTEMGGTLKRYPLQVGTYATARLSGGGDWQDPANWSGGLPTLTSTAWIDGGASISVSSAAATARNLYVGVGQHGLSGVGTLELSAAPATLSVGSLLVGVTEGLTLPASGAVHHLAGSVSAGTGIIGYRGNGAYTHTGGTLTVGDLTLARERASSGTYTIQSSPGADPVLNVASLVVGCEGAAVLTQLGGTVNVAADLQIGRFNGSSGRYDLSAGVLNVGSSLVVGASQGAVGTLSITGGSFTARRGAFQRGTVEMIGGAGTILYADLAPTASIRLAGGNLHVTEGGVFLGTIDFAGTSTHWSVAGLVDLSNGTVVNASNAILTAAPGSLVMLPPSFHPSDFASVNASGAIVQSAGSTITIGAGINVQGYGTVREFVAVEGSLSAIAGVGGSDLVLVKGFNVASGASLLMGSTGNAFISQHSRSDGGNVSGGSLRLSANVSLIQTAGTLNLTGQMRLQPSATLSLLGGALSAGSLDLRGQLFQSSGTLTISGPTSLTGEFIQSGGRSTHLRIESPVQPPSTAAVRISGGSMTTGAIEAFRLEIDGSGNVRLDPDGSSPITSVVRTLSIATAPSSTARLDLHAEKLVVDYAGGSPLDLLTAAVQRGHSGGAWTGNGITSSTAAAQSARRAVGIADAAQLSLTEFGGYSLIDPADPGAPITAVVIAYTWAGDANLDNAVSIGDFALLASNFNAQGSWAAGDFDYDGVIGLSDFAILAGNFNVADRGELAAVPEPTLILHAGCLAILTARHLRFRQQKNRL